LRDWDFDENISDNSKIRNGDKIRVLPLNFSKLRKIGFKIRKSRGSSASQVSNTSTHPKVEFHHENRRRTRRRTRRINFKLDQERTISNANFEKVFNYRRSF